MTGPAINWTTYPIDPDFIRGGDYLVMIKRRRSGVIWYSLLYDSGENWTQLDMTKSLDAAKAAAEVHYARVQS